jgi:hypothetical protein
MNIARMYYYRLICAVAFAGLLAAPARLAAQPDGPGQTVQPGPFRSIIPVFHDRLTRHGSESPLQLRTQAFVLFVFRNAVAVYSQAEFVNAGPDTMTQEFALPSTGHDRYDDQAGDQDDPQADDQSGGMVSNGILSPRVWVEGDRIAAEVVEDGDGEWYAIRASFMPGEARKLEALFWSQTSLTDVDSLPGLDSAGIAPGKRGFLVDIAHAGVWNDVIDSIGVTAVLRGGLSFKADSFEVRPETYDIQDSTLTWSFESAEPVAENDVVFDYSPSSTWPPAMNTMAGLSSYIVTKVYDQLLEYARQMEAD